MNESRVNMYECNFAVQIYVKRDLFIGVTWFMHVFHVTHSFVSLNLPVFFYYNKYIHVSSGV